MEPDSKFNEKADSAEKLTLSQRIAGLTQQDKNVILDQVGTWSVHDVASTCTCSVHDVASTCTCSVHDVASTWHFLGIRKKILSFETAMAKKLLDYSKVIRIMNSRNFLTAWLYYLGGVTRLQHLCLWNKSMLDVESWYLVLEKNTPTFCWPPPGSIPYLVVYAMRHVTGQGVASQSESSWGHHVSPISHCGRHSCPSGRLLGPNRTSDIER